MLTITGHYDPNTNNLTIRTSDNSVLAHCDYPPTHSTLKRDDYHVGEEWLHYNPAHNVHHFFIAAAAKLTATLAKQDENLIISTGELTIREPQYRLTATDNGIILVTSKTTRNTLSPHSLRMMTPLLWMCSVPNTLVSPTWTMKDKLDG